jgi:hypothetical protein
VWKLPENLYVDLRLKSTKRLGWIRILIAKATTLTVAEEQQRPLDQLEEEASEREVPTPITTGRKSPLRKDPQQQILISRCTKCGMLIDPRRTPLRVEDYRENLTFCSFECAEEYDWERKEEMEKRQKIRQKQLQQQQKQKAKTTTTMIEGVAPTGGISGWLAKSVSLSPSSGESAKFQGFEKIFNFAVSRPRLAFGVSSLVVAALGAVLGAYFIHSAYVFLQLADPRYWYAGILGTLIVGISAVLSVILGVVYTMFLAAKHYSNLGEEGIEQSNPAEIPNKS